MRQKCAVLYLQTLLIANFTINAKKTKRNEANYLPTTPKNMQIYGMKVNPKKIDRRKSQTGYSLYCCPIIFFEHTMY